MSSTALGLAVFARLIVALVMGGAAAEERSDSPAKIAINLAGDRIPASESRVAAEGPMRVSLAWCVESGPLAGVYLRERRGLIWDAAPIRVAESINPRDLTILLDEAGQTHLAWTDYAGARRRVHYSVAAEGTAFQEPIIVSIEAEADADYPQLANVNGSGIVFVWQSVKENRYSIQAAALNGADSSFHPLPALSESSRTAISPQILRTDPLIVTWDEILDHTSEIRAAMLGESGNAWEGLNLPWLGHPFAFGQQPGVEIFSGDADGLDRPFFCWSSVKADGSSSIRIARDWNESAPAISLSDPTGDHRQPQLLPTGLATCELAWQIFAGGSQAVYAASLDTDAVATRSVRLSPEQHRFASNPTIVGSEGWSVATWTDNFLDGGTGEVGFAEIRWPSIQENP